MHTRAVRSVVWLEVPLFRSAGTMRRKGGIARVLLAGVAHAMSARTALLALLRPVGRPHALRLLSTTATPPEDSVRVLVLAIEPTA